MDITYPYPPKLSTDYFLRIQILLSGQEYEMNPDFRISIYTVRVSVTCQVTEFTFIKTGLESEQLNQHNEKSFARNMGFRCEKI